MKKLLSILLVSIFLFTACTFQDEGSQDKSTVIKESQTESEISSVAGLAQGSDIDCSSGEYYGTAKKLNFDVQYFRGSNISNEGYNIPLRVIESESELNTYLVDIAEGMNVEGYDSTFFEEKSLVVITKKNTSLIEHKITKVIANNDFMEISMTTESTPIGACVMAYWQIFVVIDKEYLNCKNITISETSVCNDSNLITNNSTYNTTYSILKSIDNSSYDRSIPAGIISDHKYTFIEGLKLPHRNEGRLFKIIQSENEFLDYFNTENNGSELLSKFDSEYFSEKTLVVISGVEGSGSIKVNIENIICNNDAYIISVKRTCPEICTDDLAGWTFIIEMDKTYTQGRDAILKINPIIIQ